MRLTVRTKSSPQRLVTPPGGVVLDPFAGSGSTGVAAQLDGFRFFGIELTPEYVESARKRLAHHVGADPATHPAESVGQPTAVRTAGQLKMF